MSTILKALRRLEQEKSTRTDRPLGEAVANSPPVPAKHVSPWLVAAGSVATAFSVTVGVLWFLGSSAPEPAPAPVAEAQTEPSAPEAGAEAAAKTARSVNPARQRAMENSRARREARIQRAASQPEQTLAPSALASEVAVVERNRPARSPDVEPTPPRLETPPSDPPRPGLAALRPRTTGSSPADPFGGVVLPPARTPASPGVEPARTPAPDPKPAVVESPPAPPAEPEVVVAAVVPPKPEPAPPVVAKPTPEPAAPPRRKSTPTPPAPDPEVFVARTIWHPIADRRIAVVEYGDAGDPVEIREGDVIGRLVVDRIEPSGVSFLHNGVALRRRVGER